MVASFQYLLMKIQGAVRKGKNEKLAIKDIQHSSLAKIEKGWSGKRE